ERLLPLEPRWLCRSRTHFAEAHFEERSKSRFSRSCLAQSHLFPATSANSGWLSNFVYLSRRYSNVNCRKCGPATQGLRQGLLLALGKSACRKSGCSPTNARDSLRLVVVNSACLGCT